MLPARILLCSMGTTDCRQIAESPDQSELPFMSGQWHGGSGQTSEAGRRVRQGEARPQERAQDCHQRQIDQALDGARSRACACLASTSRHIRPGNRSRPNTTRSGRPSTTGASKIDQAAVYNLKILLHTVKSENAQAVASASSRALTPRSKKRPNPRPSERVMHFLATLVYLRVSLWLGRRVCYLKGGPPRHGLQ
jgi:hypothetical protein